jgi:hypothetical protein
MNLLMDLEDNQVGHISIGNLERMAPANKTNVVIFRFNMYGMPQANAY